MMRGGYQLPGSNGHGNGHSGPHLGMEPVAQAALMSPRKPGSAGGAIVRSSSASAGASAAGAGGVPRMRLPAEMEQMVGAIDQRVTHVAQAEDARVRMLADQAQRLHEGLQAMRVAREIHEERRSKEVRMIESNVMLDLNNARQARADIEQRSEVIAQQRVEEHRQELLRQRQQHQEGVDNFTRELGDELRRISAILDEQRASRLEYGERIAQSLEVEFQKVNEAVLAEQGLRYEAEGTMLRMVEDVCSRLRGEISQERLEREAVQAKLLGLLEDTCNRIECSFGTVQPAM
eukprot:TRINITY_DN124690_c0_g1_i1.p1 TRINITY_DN124690_c0_g1~~TRINITY_DN124690_c0_g1_i1.p1  ORF type:complete len:291 (+),score=93.99 TRINITY_DN124690_c0_g1_i1:72-944(+)